MSPFAIRLITLLGVGLVLALGLRLAYGPYNKKHHDLGVGLASGAMVGLAIFALQLSNDRIAQDAENRQQEAIRVAENRQEEAARREALQLTIATTSDLSGFDPPGQSLVGVYLAGKTLNDAQFDDVDLTDAVLRDTKLRRASLSGARLKDADLIGADLTEASLEGANLSGADLHAAKFDHAYVETAQSLAGATANADTCWPLGFLTSQETEHLVADLKTDPIKRPGGRRVPPSPGHTCGKSDRTEEGS